MVIVDRYRYGCGTNKDRGSAACPSRIKIPRETIERVLLEGIKRDILSADAFKEFERETRRLLRETSPDPTAQRRALTQAKAELDNILAAIRAGILTASTKAALEEAEVRVEIAQRDLAAAESFQPTEFLPRARETFRDMVEKLESIEDVPAARESIRGIFGGPLRIVAEGEDVFAETAANDCQITVVAGAGFWTWRQRCYSKRIDHYLAVRDRRRSVARAHSVCSKDTRSTAAATASIRSRIIP